MAACKSGAASRKANNDANGFPTYQYECRQGTDNGGTFIALYDNYGGAPSLSYRQAFRYDGPVCGGLQPRQGELQLDTTSTQRACDGSCEYAMTSGDQDSNGLGQSIMRGTWTPTGHQCSTSSPGFDGSPQPPPANLCAKGSCMNPNNGDVCSYDATGKQMCVGGPIAQGPGGACTGSDAGAICAGQKPPLPTPPQLSQINDPATEITGSDHYTHTSTPTDGGLPIVTPINVNTYGVGGPQQSPTTSGQTGADKGPPKGPASGSSAGTSNTAAGGGDCSSPPMMTGDAALAMIARQEWLARCGPDKTDKNNNGQPDWTEVTDSDGDRYGVTDTNPSSVFQEKTVDMTQVDQTSWAGNTCPDIGTAEVFGQQWTAADPELFCAWLAKVRACILVFGAIAAATILALGSR